MSDKTMSMKRNWDEWMNFHEVLRSGYRPENFEDCWEIVGKGVSGFFQREAEATWDVLKALDNEQPITSLVEIGRNLGGTLFVMACACRNLKTVLSVDIRDYEPGDEVFREWFADFGIDCLIDVADSMTYPATGEWDLVLIDGGHTGETVKADIDLWADRTRIIGFHDYADKHRNKHKRCYPDVVAEISKQRDERGWHPYGKRRKSEAFFLTKAYYER